MVLKKLFVQNWKTFAFLTFLVFAVYLNSLGNDFVSDDIPAILNNQSLGDFRQVITQPFHFIRFLLYFMAYKIGGLNPFLYHIINIIFHLGTVWLVYALIGLIATQTIAIFSAAIFAVHPLQTESVTWISGGVHSQYSFFIFLSLVSYILFLRRQDKKFLVNSLIAFVLAVISSEKALVLPFLLFLFVISFENLTKTWKNLIPFGLIGMLFGLVYFSEISQRTTALQTQFYQQPGMENPLLQIPIAITSYLELIFWPKNLTLYHSEMIFSQTQYFLRLGVFVLFLAALIFFFKKDRRIFFWLSFFLISLLPTLTPLGISWIVAERYIYLGALGIIVVAALAIQKIGELIKNQKVSYVIFGIIILVLSIRTIVRNADWKNQDTLWLATAKVSPSSSQNHNNLGDYYGRHNNFEKAVQEFKIAIQLQPNYGDAYHNLANTYQQMKKYDLAIENYQKALSFNPNLWQSYQNLAVIYFQEEKFNLAKENLQKAIIINPQNANLHAVLGIVYLKINEKQKAEQEFQQALQFDPQNQTAKQFLLSF